MDRRTKQQVVRLAILLFVGLLLSCSRANPTVSSSGDEALDQTATFILYVINEVKRRPGMDSPSKVIGYVTSPIGSAEFTPPSKELEPDFADYYRGPRPGKGVGYSSAPKPIGILPKEILLSADDKAQKIYADAYHNTTQPIHRWQWPF